MEASEKGGQHPSVYGDAFTFYALGLLSFLESTVDVYIENLLPFFRADLEVARWLETTWRVDEARHGLLTRAYVERVWPDFDWPTAYSQFLRTYTPRCEHECLRPTPALEALARCVTETHSAMIYRCLSLYTQCSELKHLMERLSIDEVRHYAYFRSLFNKYERVERVTLWQKSRVIVTRSALVRDEDLALAFEPLNYHWSKDAPFQPMRYPEFLGIASAVMLQHFPFDSAKRMLFRPLRCGSKLENVLAEILSVVVRRQYLRRSKG